MPTNYVARSVANNRHASAEIMHAFLHLLEEKYGGVEAYLRRYVHLTDEDIDIIRRNLLVPQDNTDS